MPLPYLQCEEVRRLLPSYIFEDSSLDEADVLSAHLAGCAACREQEGYLRTVVRAVRRRDRARIRAQRQRQRLRLLGGAAIIAACLALGLYLADSDRRAGQQRDAQLATAVQILSEQVASLRAGASPTTVATSRAGLEPPPPVAAQESAEAVAGSRSAPPSMVSLEPPQPPAPPAPPAPPTVAAAKSPAADRQVNAVVASPAANPADAAGPIKLLDIGEPTPFVSAAAVDSGTNFGPLPFRSATAIEPAGQPYSYPELRALILAGVQPESSRVDPSILIDRFSPDYRTDAESSLVVDLYAAPSPFVADLLLMTVGVAHQPIASTTPSRTDYSFILADGGSGVFHRTLRNALLPWLFDKLDGGCRVSVLTAGAEGATLLDNEPIRVSKDGLPVLGRLAEKEPVALYEAVAAQRARLTASREEGSERRHHLMVLATADCTLPGPDTAPWPDRLGSFRAPWLDFSVVLLDSSAAGASSPRPYLAELARQGDGRFIQVGTDVIGWERTLLPRVTPLASEALYGVSPEVSFNPELIGAFMPLHSQAGWAQTNIGSGDRWPTFAKLARGQSHTGVYLLRPQSGGRPDRVAECRVRFDAGDAQFSAEERRQLRPEQISGDFFTAPSALQVPAISAELAGILLDHPGPARTGRIAALRSVWSRLAPSLPADDADLGQLSALIAALW